MVSPRARSGLPRLLNGSATWPMHVRWASCHRLIARRAEAPVLGFLRVQAHPQAEAAVSDAFGADGDSNNGEPDMITIDTKILERERHSFDCCALPGTTSLAPLLFAPILGLALLSAPLQAQGAGLQFFPSPPVRTEVPNVGISTQVFQVTASDPQRVQRRGLSYFESS